MSPLAIVLLASSAPTNKMFPELAASTIKACVIVFDVPVDAGNSMFAAFVTVCWSAEEEATGEGIEGEIKGQQMDHSKLVPLLVKTVQELEARIATLEG